MSRKVFEDKTSWKTPSLYVFASGYGPFRAKAFDPIEDLVVMLYNGDGIAPPNNEQHRRHAMYDLAAEAQTLLVKDETELLLASPSICNGILVIDIRDMFEDQEEFDLAMKNEILEVEAGAENANTNSKKSKGKKSQGQKREIKVTQFSRPLIRLFKRMRLQNIILAANGELCVLALILHKQLALTDPEIITGLRLVYPQLSAQFINTHMVATKTTTKKEVPFLKTVDLVVEEENSRVDMLKYVFPQMNIYLSEPNVANGVLAMASCCNKYADADADVGEQADSGDDFDPYHCNAMGKSLFLSSMTVEMNRHSKQYERNFEQIADYWVEQMSPDLDEEHTPINQIDWDSCERQVGALVLRGNRCILVRSEEWTGVRIPSVNPMIEFGETPIQAAIRAVEEFAEVDSSEVRELKHVLPVSIYAPNDRPVLVEVYALYVVNPPPDGPLENADEEDEEDPYDWYTFSNAINRLDAASNAALRTMAFNLAQAATAGLVPDKWGGVFGQEST